MLWPSPSNPKLIPSRRRWQPLFIYPVTDVQMLLNKAGAICWRLSAVTYETLSGLYRYKTTLSQRLSERGHVLRAAVAVGLVYNDDERQLSDRLLASLCEKAHPHLHDGLTAVKARELLAWRETVVFEHTSHRYALEGLGALTFTTCFSRHCLVWVRFTKTTEAVIAGCEVAWAFVYGVFTVLIPDNVSVIDKSGLTDPRFNQAFVEYSESCRLYLGEFRWFYSQRGTTTTLSTWNNFDGPGQPFAVQISPPIDSCAVNFFKLDQQLGPPWARGSPSSRESMRFCWAHTSEVRQYHIVQPGLTCMDIQCLDELGVEENDLGWQFNEVAVDHLGDIGGGFAGLAAEQGADQPGLALDAQVAKVTVFVKGEDWG
ncbi:hypothetical protein QBC33DRAFT_519829 [Phialemonium atrogriseum]|uniref:Uncharacterized protein n=1 Tax=Phialemonium atrogriseum TaxID=1093897 RepID=A0AAJ0BPM8_9PEZI|nr:uncharacterized protein QBC33DRAFT_519829 [Phialemonium atrogriseum]KAK1762158.1 hypothetical protein QBC33DRAFT_519829 [Phialemonium atrogriseum]